MRVGVFGGTFNPPHEGHRILAEQAVEALRLDRLIWVPAARSPFKDGSDDVSASHRLAMTALAAADSSAFRVSDLELQREPPSYTVDTLHSFSALYPGAQLILLVGGDSWEGFDGWKDHARIRTLAEVAVYPRPGSTLPGDARPDHLLDAPRIDISSTELRSKLMTGRPVAGLIRPSVLGYIRKFGLYGA